MWLQRDRDDISSEIVIIISGIFIFFMPYLRGNRRDNKMCDRFCIDLFKPIPIYYLYQIW